MSLPASQNTTTNTTTTAPPGGAAKGQGHVDLSATGIRIDDPAFKPLLADLQGDILKANGRNFAGHVVFSFGARGGSPDPAAVRAVRLWLKGLAGRYVTSAAQQLVEAEHYRSKNADAGTFGTLGLTAQAYEWLGYDLDRIPLDRRARFLDGMTAPDTQALLNDPALDELESWSRSTIHAVLNLFDDDEDDLARTIDRVCASAAGVATVLTVQRGIRVRNDRGQPVEPFGYQDGVSQPLFYEMDQPKGEAPGGYDMSAPLSLVLLPDPNGAGPHSCGSFFVYRKLKQDVAGFHGDVAALATALKVDDQLAGAYVMGRFQDGTPVVESNHPTGKKLVDNTFQFASDPDAARCPFQAHIRKANPRGDTVRSNHAPLSVERGHRIVRRAFNIKDEGDGTGLHFLCYQSDIGDQFEFIQSSWSNQIHFNRMATGLDGVIGQGPKPDVTVASTTVIPQSWPKRWGEAAAGTTAFDFHRWVTLKGGGYFFAPSLSFFAGL